MFVYRDYVYVTHPPSLKKTYCEICLLFSDRINRNRAWIGGVSGDVRNMADKISRHEKSKTHSNAASIYGQWKSGKTVDKMPKY